MGLHEDRWCQRCRAKGEMIDGICVCGWNCDEDRWATKEETAVVVKKIDDACSALTEVLDGNDPKSVKVIQQQDQFAASLRDMSAAEREDVARAMSEDGDISLEDARQWIADMVSGE